MTDFKDITLLVTHYNRSNSLQALLETFSDMKISFGQIVISDDASAAEHIDVLKKLADEYSADLVLAKENGGLGNNINKGQDKVQLPLTLYVQEDFRPKPVFVKALVDAASFMQDDPQLDVVRFYAYGRYPYLTPFKNGFSWMDFNVKYKGYGKFYAYSDHPHLRRSTFFEKFGKYKLGHNPEQTEYRMMMSYLQKKGKGLFYEDHKALFDHVNTSDEPSTMTRNSIRRGNNPVIKQVRNLYRHVKFNANYLFGKY